MIENLVKHGNSWALIIDRPILDLLNISPESPVEITTDRCSITVSPVDEDGHQKQVREASGKVNARYKKAFRKLAESLAMPVFLTLDDVLELHVLELHVGSNNESGSWARARASLLLGLDVRRCFGSRHELQVPEHLRAEQRTSINKCGSINDPGRPPICHSS